MAVLITGGAGYIGSHMAWACVDKGDEVVVLDNLSTGFRWAVPPQATFVEGDIADRDLVMETIRAHGIDTVVHFAGSIIVPESVADPLKYYDNNTGRTRTLLQACVDAGLEQFIFSSTAAVYGVLPNMRPVDELTPLAPASPYGHSKLMSEQMVRDVSEATGLRYVMLRYFNVAGADPRGRTGLSARNATHVMKLACEAATGKRDFFEVYGTDYDTPDGSAVRDFIHVTDLADAHYVALNFLRAGGRKFTGNAGYSRGASVFEVVDAVKRISGVDFEVRLADRRAGDVPAIVADASRMGHRLSWKPRHDELETIVRHALAWEEKLKSIRAMEAEAAREAVDAPPIQPSLDTLTDRVTLV